MDVPLLLSPPYAQGLELVERKEGIKGGSQFHNNFGVNAAGAPKVRGRDILKHLTQLFTRQKTGKKYRGTLKSELESLTWEDTKKRRFLLCAGAWLVALLPKGRNRFAVWKMGKNLTTISLQNVEVNLQVLGLSNSLIYNNTLSLSGSSMESIEVGNL